MQAHQVHDEGSLPGGAEANGDGHGEGPDGGGEHGQDAEEQRNVRRVGLEPDHGVEGDGVDDRRQHPQQQPIQSGCSAPDTPLSIQALQLIIMGP